MLKIRVLIADDHAMLRECIRALLGQQKDIEIVGEASEGKEAIRKVDELKPDVILLDIAMPELDGLEAARQIRKQYPTTKILILTQHDNKEYILSAIKAGVSGYVPKKALASELISAIRSVYQGNPFLFSNALIALIEDYRHKANIDSFYFLTTREKDILKLIAQGYTSKSIAEQLKINFKTVQGHRAKLMEKLGTRSHAELIKVAINKGLVNTDEQGINDTGTFTH
jgi:DNA-binding NarL/FixJ family response regulator